MRLKMEKMIKVSEDIVRFDDKEAIENLIQGFYKIMKENGICWGTKVSDGGITGSNYEWTIAKNHFILTVVQLIEWGMLIHELPDDLRHYGKRKPMESLRLWYPLN